MRRPAPLTAPSVKALLLSMHRLSILAGLTLCAMPVAAQLPAALAAERAAYAEWLRSAITSPYRAIAQQPIGPGLTIGAGADLPLEGVPVQRLRQDDRGVTLEAGTERRAVPPQRPMRAGRFSLVVGGTPGRAIVTVFDSAKQAGAPEYFEHRAELAFVGALTPAAAPRTQRMLAPDGVEVEATEAGTVSVPVGGRTTRLRVMRMPDPVTGESELEIFFRDSTNAGETYPAGRFVSLVPAGDGRYRLDFNRARNPFCAYSSAYACPAPWSGNLIPARVAAGEKYRAK